MHKSAFIAVYMRANFRYFKRISFVSLHPFYLIVNIIELYFFKILRKFLPFFGLVDKKRGYYAPFNVLSAPNPAYSRRQNKRRFDDLLTIF